MRYTGIILARSVWSASRATIVLYCIISNLAAAAVVYRSLGSNSGCCGWQWLVSVVGKCGEMRGIAAYYRGDLDQLCLGPSHLHFVMTLIPTPTRPLSAARMFLLRNKTNLRIAERLR